MNSVVQLKTSEESQSEQNEEKKLVLNAFLRLTSFSTLGEKDVPIKDKFIRAISKSTHLPEVMVKNKIKQFLIDLLKFKFFFSHMLSKHVKKASAERISLRKRIEFLYLALEKIHGYAPVFDLDRAMINTEILLEEFDRCCRWPTITTQLALVIFVTDIHDTLVKEKKIRPIKQVNIRRMCDVSAYAFHRTRNLLHI